MIKSFRIGTQFVFFVLALALSLSIGAGSAGAQSSSARGRLDGTILDAKGLLVPEATVTVRNTATGESLTQQADDRGYFLFLYLAPGNYEVSIEKAGFTHLDVHDVVINVGTTSSLHPQLAVGQVETKVTVTADAPLVDTTQSSLATVVGRQSICLLYTSPSPRDLSTSRMPSSA